MAAAQEGVWLGRAARLFCLGCLLPGAGVAAAQGAGHGIVRPGPLVGEPVPPEPLTVVPANVATELATLADAAAAIFTGTVVTVERDDAGAVEVRFLVETAVRGATPGALFVLREWDGLWGGYGQTPRYVPGQRRLMLLTAPGAAGLSAPVGGSEGSIPLVGAPVPAGGAEAPPAACDLRWIEAAALRSASGAADAAEGGEALPTLGPAAGDDTVWAGPPAPFLLAADGSQRTALVTLPAVLAVLMPGTAASAHVRR